MYKSKKSTTFLFIVLIILLFIFLHNINFFSFLEKPIKKLGFLNTSFFYKKNNSQELDDLKKMDKDYLIEKISLLNQEIKENENYKIKNEILSAENEELKKQLNFFEKNNYKSVGAEVIGRAVDPLGTTLIVNRGESDNLKIDNPVIIGDGVLVGKIISVSEEESIVRLINDNNSKIGATILNKDNSLGLVEGGYGLGVKMDYIPQNEVVNIGDVVVTSGLSEGIPQGLIIGKIEVVEKQAHQPFQQAILKTSADLSCINVVSVIIRNE